MLGLLFKLKRLVPWFKNADKKKAGGIAGLALMAFFVWWQSSQLSTAKESLSLTKDALATANQTIERQMAEAAINDALRQSLEKKVRKREQALADAQAGLDEDLEDIGVEYRGLVNKEKERIAKATNDGTQQDETEEIACHAEFENLLDRAANAATDRMWRYYRSQTGH